MNDFALITEGILDQVTIEAILAGFYMRDLDITSIQPSRDSTDESRQLAFGGWERVLERCEQDDFADIFSANKYLIIQIDTDDGEHTNYGVALTEGGADRGALDIITDVEGLIQTKIGTDKYQKYSNRIIFAIAVHSTDCWYLPRYSKSRAHKTKTKNCASTLERNLKKEGMNYAKEFHCYNKLAKEFENNEVLLNSAQENISLDQFIKKLPADI